MRRFTICLLMLTAAAAAMMAATGAERRMVTLDECRSLAVQNNAKVKLADDEALAAHQVERQAFTKYFPTVSAGALQFWSNKPVFHYDVMNMFTLEFLKKGFGANIHAVQPVFAGGRIVNGNRLARIGVEAGDLKRQNAVDEVMLTAEQYYYDLVALKAKRSTLQSLIVTIDSLCAHVQVAVDAGVVLPNDLLKARLQQTEYEMLMVDLDNGIDLSSKLLAQYIGLDGTPIDIPEAAMPEQLPPFPAALRVDPAEALPTTVDYRLLDAQVRAADLQTKIAVGQNMPTVGVGAGYFYDDLLNERYSFGTLFISITVPISDWWSGSHAIKQRKIEAESARTQMADLSQMIMLNMDNAWDNLTSAYRKMELAKKSIDQASENLRLNENYYNAGISTITDLLEAQTLYRRSCDSYIEAYSSFCLQKARYLDATGRSPMPGV